MSTRLKELQLGWMLLTRLPVGRLEDPVPKTADAAWTFPLVGCGLGLAMWAIWSLALWLGLSGLAAALLAIACQAILTGGLHEDGLADVADGFGGGQSRARKLEIMRDSRIGSYGVLALILAIGLTASAMAEAGGLVAFIAVAAISRTAMLVPMAMLSPAREDGLGKGAAASFSPPLLAAFLITLVPGIIVLPVLPVVVILTFVLVGLYRQQIDGQTGDTLGATQKLTESASWLTLAAIAA